MSNNFIVHPETKAVYNSLRWGVYTIFDKSVGWKKLQEMGFEKVDTFPDYMGEELFGELGEKIASLYAGQTLTCPVTGYTAVIDELPSTTIININGGSCTTTFGNQPTVGRYMVKYFTDTGEEHMYVPLGISGIMNLQLTDGSTPAQYLKALVDHFGSLSLVKKNLRADRLHYLRKVVDALDLSSAGQLEFYRNDFRQVGYQDVISWIAKDKLKIFAGVLEIGERSYQLTFSDGTSIEIHVRLEVRHEEVYGINKHAIIHFVGEEHPAWEGMWSSIPEDKLCEYDWVKAILQTVPGDEAIVGLNVKGA